MAFEEEEYLDSLISILIFEIMTYVQYDSFVVGGTINRLL